MTIEELFGYMGLAVIVMLIIGTLAGWIDWKP
jgi:hypothetical protein